MNTLRLAPPQFGVLVALGSLAMSATASAQWSNDPALNLAVADSSSDQSQSKLASTADGGTWTAWFDGIGSGWDVRIQKLDAAGLEVFAHNGLLVADRSFSSTQDYGLDVSSTDDAFIVFRDDRPGGTQITAAKVTAAGVQAWGATGVNLTSTGNFVANPKIAGTDDGGAVVAWIENASVKVQKLDANGVALWGAGVTLQPGSGSYSTAGLEGVGNSSILSIVHQTGGFSSPKHLVAQKFDAAGAAQWGASPLAVFDGGSLQFGNFPAFTTDDAGGAVFSWYSSSPSLQCFAQRVSSAGVEAWPHNGVALATTAGNIRVNPSAAFDATSNEVYATWVEGNSAQSQSGIRAQRLSAAGARLWTDAGAELVALGSTQAGMPRIIVDAANGGALMAWAEAPSFGTDQLFGAHLDVNGAVDVPRFDIASTPSGKSRLQATTSTAGFVVMSWKDARTDNGDIYAQNVAFDGALGGESSIGSNYCMAVLNSTGVAGSMGASGSTAVSSNDVTLMASDLPTGAFGFFIASRDAGFVANPGGSLGNLCLGSPIGRYVGTGQTQNSGPQGMFSLTIDLTMTPQPTATVAVAVGETWRFQAWHRDMVAGMAVSNFTDGLEITFN